MRAQRPLLSSAALAAVLALGIPPAHADPGAGTDQHGDQNRSVTVQDPRAWQETPDEPTSPEAGKPADQQKAADQQKPTDQQKPADQQKPDTQQKSIDQPKPADPPKPDGKQQTGDTGATLKIKEPTNPKDPRTHDANPLNPQKPDPQPSDKLRRRVADDGSGPDKPHGGVHTGGGGLSVSGGGLASGAVLLVGGLGVGAYALRRRRPGGSA